MVYRDETMVAVAQGSRIQEMVVGNAKERTDPLLLYPTRCFFDVNFHRVTEPRVQLSRDGSGKTIDLPLLAEKGTMERRAQTNMDKG